MLAPPRRPLIVLSVIVLLAIILFISSHHEPTTAKLEKWLPSIGPNNAEAQWHRGVRRRTNALRQKCAEPDVFEKMYGRTNIRMSRGYEGESVCAHASTRACVKWGSSDASWRVVLFHTSLSRQADVQDRCTVSSVSSTRSSVASL